MWVLGIAKCNCAFSQIFRASSNSWFEKVHSDMLGIAFRNAAAPGPAADCSFIRSLGFMREARLVKRAAEGLRLLLLFGLWKG